MRFISIDQNCSPLWDVAPKLAALTARGYVGTHYVEDIDIAYSRHGAAAVELAPESYYRGGASDWGATLFAFDFLGRLPLDVRQFEPFTGLASANLAKRIDLSLDELYARYSGSDNWQLVGASYLAGDKNRHKLLGDLTVASVAPFARRLLARARENLCEIFVEPAARARIENWHQREEFFIENGGDERLGEFYRQWLRRDLGDAVQFGLTSQLFALTDDGANRQTLTWFLRDYATLAQSYNDAVGTEMRPLNDRRGELPFFAIFHDGKNCWREPLFLADGELRAATRSWQADALPIATLRRDGVVALAAKAILLVLQARLTGAALALPEQGSLYMPAAYALQKKLAAWLPPDLPPVWRVKLNFFDRMAKAKTRLRPPVYWRGVFGDREFSAGELVEAIRARQSATEQMLAPLREKTTRAATWRKLFPAFYARRDEWETQRKNCGQAGRKNEAAEIWRQIRGLDLELWREQIDWLTAALQLRNLSYFNARGAIYPWSIALGGEEFYRGVVAGATVEEEAVNSEQ
ncbi:hypothetical protein AGMMS49959_13070 [Planctomycetales bacterium]|nr:hypothetical protein AGMMS49959_13070 [Planctomycetales bacterium]